MLTTSHQGAYGAAAFCYEELLLINPLSDVYHCRYAEILYARARAEGTAPGNAGGRDGIVPVEGGSGDGSGDLTENGKPASGSELLVLARKHFAQALELKKHSPASLKVRALMGLLQGGPFLWCRSLASAFRCLASEHLKLTCPAATPFKTFTKTHIASHGVAASRTSGWAKSDMKLNLMLHDYASGELLRLYKEKASAKPSAHGDMPSAAVAAAKRAATAQLRAMETLVAGQRGFMKTQGAGK